MNKIILVMSVLLAGCSSFTTDNKFKENPLQSELHHVSLSVHAIAVSAERRGDAKPYIIVVHGADEKSLAMIKDYLPRPDQDDIELKSEPLISDHMTASLSQ